MEKNKSLIFKILVVFLSTYHSFHLLYSVSSWESLTSGFSPLPGGARCPATIENFLSQSVPLPLPVEEEADFLVLRV